VWESGMGSMGIEGGACLMIDRIYVGWVGGYRVGVIFAVSWWGTIKNRSRCGLRQVWVSECGILWVLLGSTMDAIVRVK